MNVVFALDSNITLDNQTAVESLAVTATNDRYVNINAGNDLWDGSSPTYISGTVGPKQHISSGLAVSVNSGNLYIAAGTYKESKLTITKNLTIIGEGKTNTTIDAGGSNLIFWIKPGTVVTINNLNITNGTASSDTFSRNGGGIYNEGILTLEKCIFYNNRAKDASDAGGAFGSDASPAGNGGAIYNKGTLTITNCDFLNNHAGQGGDASATHKSSSGGNGGAIYNIGSILNIQGCTFSNNYAGRGGASSAFHDGKKGGDGGAIYNTKTINNMKSCTFINNHAGNGGSVQAGTAANPGDGGNGGALYSNGTVTITDSLFDGNYAGNGGEGSDLNKAGNGGHGGSIYNTGTLNISTTEIKNGHAGNGGVAHGAYSAGNGGHGGAIYNMKTLTITNCNIHHNLAGNGLNGATAGSPPGVGGNGGGIYNGASLTIQSSEIHDNIAGKGGDASVGVNGAHGGHGGAIFNSATLNLTSTNIYNNTAGTGGMGSSEKNGGSGGNGGGIYNNGFANLQSSKLYYNAGGTSGKGKGEGGDPGAGGHGGAIFNQNSLTVLNCEIYKNKAGTGGNPKEGYHDGKGGYGGAIYLDNGSNASISSTSIHDNSAGTGIYGGHGGAIFNNGILTLTGCTLDNNKAVFLSTSNALDVAAGNGGGIYNTGTLNISNCQITNNSAGTGPNGDDATWQKNLYYYAGGNGANGGSGGGIYNTGILTITGSSINGNHAGDGGKGGNGSPCFSDDNGIPTLGTLDPGNGGNGGNGGGIYNSGTIISITNSTINNNTAGRGGDGGSYADDYSVDLWYKVTPGKAGIGGNGGGIYTPGPITTIENTTINYNQAGKGGNGNPVSRYSAEDGNNGGNGGGLVIFNSLVIKNSQISNNKAGDGGNGGNTYTSSGNNPSTKPGNAGNGGHGGGIFLSCTSTNLVLNMTGTTMNNNLAGNGGNPGIDNDGSNTSPSNGGTGGNGGAFELITTNVSYLKVYIYESTFTHNQAGQETNGPNGGQNGLPGIGGVIHSKNFNYLSMNFNRIVDNTPQAFYMDLNASYPINVSLINNWWGSNANPSNQIAGNNSGSIIYSPWLTLKAQAVPTLIYNSQTSTISANLIINSNGEDTSTYGRYVPDGTPVTFKTNAGTVNPPNSTTNKGSSSTIFTANISGIDTVDTTVDHQTVFTQIQVNTLADVILTKTVNGIIIVGQDFMATVTAENKGPDIATNLVFMNTIPSQFQFLNASTDRGTWIYDPISKIFTWNIGDLEIGTAHLYLSLKALEAGTYSLNHFLSSGTYDPHPENHNAPLILQVNNPRDHEVNPIKVVKADKTLKMEETGLTLSGLILAILAVLGGLASAKRK